MTEEAIVEAIKKAPEGWRVIDPTLINVNEFIEKCVSIIDKKMDVENGFVLSLDIKRWEEKDESGNMVLRDIVIRRHKLEWPIKIWEPRPEMHIKDRYSNKQLESFKYAKIDANT